MLPVGWKTLSVFLAVAALLSISLLLSPPHHLAHRLSHALPHPHQPHFLHDPAAPPLPNAGSTSDGWTFNPTRDADNPALKHEQCTVAFPDLYYEIDRAASVWRERERLISEDDIDIKWRNDAAFRVLVHNNQLRVLYSRHTIEGYQPRTSATLHQLHRALLGAAAAGEILPDAEFSITVADMTLIPGDTDKVIWGYTRHLDSKPEERVWVMPDFNFWAATPMASGFQDMRWKAQQQDMGVMDKIPKAVWRGAEWTNPPVRGKLLEVTKGKEWADCQEATRKNESNTLPMEALCRYMFPVHTEGRSWSGRLKFLLNCDSLPVVHHLDWRAHYYHLLVPDGDKQNYIPVKRNFSDLEDKINWFLGRPEHATRVARNAIEQFRDRYTTLAAENCYWRRMISTWSEVAFKPNLYEYVTVTVDGGDFKEKRLRGVTFEEWLDLKTNVIPLKDP